jgi:hypothetical protein
MLLYVIVSYVNELIIDRSWFDFWMVYNYTTPDPYSLR